MSALTLRTLSNNWLLAITLCLGSTSLDAQSWSRAARFGGDGSELGAAVKISPAGDRYFTGYFSDAVKFGKKTLASAGDTDIFLAKFNQWAVPIGGTGHDEGTDLALDTAGNVFLTGWFTNSATFHSTDGSSVIVTGNGNGETIFLAKYSPAGVLAWVQSGTDSFFSINRGHGVAVDAASGAAYLTGISQGSTVFSSSNGISNEVPGPGSWHMYLVKYDADGNFQWGGWNEADANSIPHKVAVDADGSAYVTGWFEGGATFHGVDGNDQTVIGLSEPIQNPPDYPDDSFIVKYDHDGNVKWVNNIGGYKAIMNDITVSDSGEISVTGLIGNINGTAQQQVTLLSSQPPGTTISVGGGAYTNPYNRDVLVASYDASGVALSAARIGGVDNEEAGGIVALGSDLYVSGMLESTGNLFIAKVNGEFLQWIKQDGGPVTGAIETLPRISLASDGIVAIGSFLNTSTFGTYQLQSQGAEDGFLAKLRVP